MDLALFRPYRVRALVRALLELYSTTSLDALVRTTGAAWENEGGKVEVDARFRRKLVTKREREVRGDRERTVKRRKRRTEKAVSLVSDSPIDFPAYPVVVYPRSIVSTAGPHHCSRTVTPGRLITFMTMKSAGYVSRMQ